MGQDSENMFARKFTFEPSITGTTWVVCVYVDFVKFVTGTTANLKKKRVNHRQTLVAFLYWTKYDYNVKLSKILSNTLNKKTPSSYSSQFSHSFALVICSRQCLINHLGLLRRKSGTESTIVSATQGLLLAFSAVYLQDRDAKLQVILNTTNLCNLRYCRRIDSG